MNYLAEKIDKKTTSVIGFDPSKVTREICLEISRKILSVDDSIQVSDQINKIFEYLSVQYRGKIYLSWKSGI